MLNSTTLIIGAGQAGLAAAYHLRQRSLPFIMLDAAAEIGQSWRKRWDSLRLFTPARYSSLPGMPFPAPAYSLPTKDQVADYFAAYAQRFELRPEWGVAVQRLVHEGQVFRAETCRGLRTADQVIVASGTFQQPFIPPFAGEISQNIQQLHSSAYRNPAQINGRRVLVVGAGSSGAQIALDLAQTHKVILSGRCPGNLPRAVLGIDIYDWLYGLGIMHATRESAVGRRLLARAGGDERLGITRQAILAAGIRWLPRLTKITDGLPVTEDGQACEVDAIVWATGYRPDYRWIDGLICDAMGFPLHRRGVVTSVPGLYFVGLRLQHRVDSHLIHGVGRDAEYIAEQIRQR